MVMALINETYGDPSKEVSDMKMRFYFRALEDFSISDLEAAVFHMGRAKTFHTFPTPGEIREALTGKAEDRAALAFDALIDAIHRVGIYRSPNFLDGVTGKVVDAMGGWQAVCNWNVEERQWKRKEFLKIYQAHSVHGSDGSYRCIGEFERTNMLTGHRDRIPEPIAIGGAEGTARPVPRRALKS